MTKIMIADDHALMRVGLRSILELEPDITVVGEAGDGCAAVSLAQRLKPDVIIMDLMMPKKDGAAATHEILAALPETKIVILSSYGSAPEMRRAVDAGAVGALQKESATRDILKAIRLVIAGKPFFDAEIVQMIGDLDDAPQFTERQLDVLCRMADGQGNKEIADGLGISRHGVDKHIAAIFQKLGCSTRAEAINIAHRRQILTSVCACGFAIPRLPRADKKQ